MFDDPIRPIRSVNAVADVGAVGLRRRPSGSQLRAWLSFARRAGKRAAQVQTEPEPVAGTPHQSDHQVDIEV